MSNELFSIVDSVGSCVHQGWSVSISDGPASVRSIDDVMQPWVRQYLQLKKEIVSALLFYQRRLHIITYQPKYSLVKLNGAAMMQWTTPGGGAFEPALVYWLMLGSEYSDKWIRVPAKSFSKGHDRLRQLQGDGVNQLNPHLFIQ